LRPHQAVILIDLSHVCFCQCPTRWGGELRDHTAAVDALRRSPSEQGEILIFAPEIANRPPKTLYKPKTKKNKTRRLQGAL
jgi:hypothetical protein